MAGDWIKFETATTDKPEVFEIAAELGIDPDAVIGKLLRVWKWFDEQTTDGNAPVTVRALLDRYAGVTGFCDAMEKSGWLLVDGSKLELPNFTRHNGQTAKNRALAAKRAANHRVGSNAKSNGASVTSALPREEKRREEKKLEEREIEGAVKFTQDTGDHPAGNSTEEMIESVRRYVISAGAMLHKIPDERTIEQFVSHFQSTGWHDKNGHKVRSWKDKLRTFDGFAPKGSSNGNGNGSQRQPEHPAFPKFWDASPVQQNRGKASDEFTNAIDRGATVEIIMAGLPAYRIKEKNRKSKPDYIPQNPASWLADDRFLDSPQKRQPKPGQIVIPPSPAIPEQPPEFATWCRSTLTDFDGNIRHDLPDSKIEEMWMDRHWRNEFAMWKPPELRN